MSRPTPAPLGRYLRGRRDAMCPSRVGLPERGIRRVPGLRREELALLSGISLDYYIRVEQGRERPSSQVLEALARALDLDTDARAHLFRLAGAGPTPITPPGPERPDPALAPMLASWPRHPALVLGRALDVLTSNDLAEEMFDGFQFSRNLAIRLFLDPDARWLHADWDRDADHAVARLRLREGMYPGDPRIREVVATLLDRSPDFTRRWARHEVGGKSALVKRLCHPRVGALTLRMLSFDVEDASGQQLVVYQADAGTPSAEAVALLGTLAASRRTTAS